MTSSSIDDQQERHFIGNLLCDEEVLAQSSPRPIDANVATVQPSNVLPSAGPIGPTPNRNFWPEPPPPYSPCTVGGAPQWAAMSHQPHGLLSPVPAPYGQALTATAVTRTDFYQSPYSRGANWDAVQAGAVEPYMPTNVPYSPHRTVSILKPVIGNAGPIDGMQHHYQAMYHHHQQQHLVPSPVDSRIFGAPQPPPSAYSAIDVTGAINVEQYSPPHAVQNAPNSSSQCEDVHKSMSAVKAAVSVPPAPGKSYRDVASKKGRSSPSLASSLPAVTRNPTAPTGTKDISRSNVKKLNSTLRTISNRGHNKAEALAVPQTNSNNNGLSMKCKDGASKKTSSCIKRGGENEFQKITHKKNKNVKGNKGEVLNVDEDGLTGNQMVDASSRFEILQTLSAQGTQMNSQKSTPSSHRSISSVDLHRDADRIGKTKIIDAIGSDVLNDRDALVNQSNKADKMRNDNNSVDAKRGNIITHRVVKKVIGTHRESSAQLAIEPTRGGRKQRSNTKKRHSNIADRINFVAALIFSIIKYCIGWFVDLLMDISLQLWDITMYSMLIAYTTVTLNCQHYWLFFMDKMRLFFDSIRDFNAKTLWKNETDQPNEWGLSENMQLPTTGEEAMERILRCHGRDAYVMLGLKANCSEDDIKRYYKRQAVLVHPDKNCLCGADEAFKLLTRAFDAIGTPDARTKYNIANLHKNPLHKEMERLWEQLRKKMDESRNSMFCDCGNKHKRIPMLGLRPSEARYCRRCKTRHSAKHNDIWAETRFVGFFWVYYACLDGVVYDITQWASCSSNQLKHMMANSHTVQYRLVTATGPVVNKSGASKQDSTGYHNLDDPHYFGNTRAGAATCEHTDCSCSTSIGYKNESIAAAAAAAATSSSSTSSSQQATYRPPDRSPFNEDRPRRAGRRRRLH